VESVINISIKRMDATTIIYAEGTEKYRYITKNTTANINMRLKCKKEYFIHFSPR
jgi:hypothetical protein